MELVICELYHPHIHFYNYNEDNKSEWEDASLHWLTIKKYKKYNKNKIKREIRIHKNRYSSINLLQLPNHPFIQNYKNIILNEKYIQLHLAKCFYLASGEKICILKTFWIKIFQRTWKRIFRERKEKLKRRCHPHSIVSFQQMGKWPKDCFISPIFKIS